MRALYTKKGRRPKPTSTVQPALSAHIALVIPFHARFIALPSGERLRSGWRVMCFFLTHLGCPLGSLFLVTLCLSHGFASFAQLGHVLVEASANVSRALAKLLPVLPALTFGHCCYWN
jgi:hypothetical protein